ncbi:hypothetical protein [Pseudodesulfovibrio sediminis]|uniref:Uncharacterized protein n=1 Tax=Pseudodesulfovibrio sediminis TaxID=2810563 RepID=A0ABM7P3J7_9BACT|nr:hypothetical protein [Pseudodesulfovibrio sediminis]BCS87350.1 hypothetical protein PSDVSF_05920 [Pseudodesulfovibrio sediminis]
MSKVTVCGAPHDWQRRANDLLGANLVGDMCGKKSRNQAYRWSREPGTGENQNGPLKHVLLVCDALVAEGSAEGREAAIDAARVLVSHLMELGLPVRLAMDVPTLCDESASMASQKLYRAVSDCIACGVENKPVPLLCAHSEHVMQRMQLFVRAYAQDYADPHGVRFAGELSEQVQADIAAMAEGVVRNKRGFWTTIFRAVLKKVRGA